MIKIAGNFTDKDWDALESQLKLDFTNDVLWNKALDFFESRIRERYIKPAEKIQHSLTAEGEGFAITVIICSLIEALETFYKGKCYKHTNPLSQYEYGGGNSKLFFVEFLSTKKPFCDTFDANLAEDFFINVRCALLHEAMTRNGWVIRVGTGILVEKEGRKKILNRSLFLDYLREYIKSYRLVVLSSIERKHSFIRKMNCICSNA